MEKPTRIYKYESFSPRSLQNLKAQAIYFGSPKGFNDPYDCAITVATNALSNEDLEKVRSSYLQSADTPANIKAQMRALSPESLREKLVAPVKKIAEKEAEEFLARRGISCFSETCNDLLMWSHYGGRYKGYCLEFSTAFEPFTRMRKVAYAAKMPKLDLTEILLKNNLDKIIDDLFCTKAESWDYEKEWRCIHNVAGTMFGYDAAALTGVYFGPDIDIESLEIICLILAGQNPNVTLWRGKRSAEEFKVEFERFTYISYIDAKRRALK